MKKNEIVYALVNPAMPGIVKIGHTSQDNVKIRMGQLQTTGVPVPFECVIAVEVDDASKVESAIHDAFDPYRLNPNREFFTIDPEQVIVILKLLSLKEVTPQVNADLNVTITQVDKDSSKKLTMLPKMDFSEMNIQEGSILIFKDGNTTVEVKNRKKVIYKGEIMTLTAATRDIKKINYNVRPARYWTYNGKLLKDIYDDIYGNE